MDVKSKRLELSRNTTAKKKSKLGQFFTPESIASFMADLFPEASGECRLLDAGAGVGCLSVAFIDRWLKGKFKFKKISIDAFEVDSDLIEYLKQVYFKLEANASLTSRVLSQDFVVAAVDSISGNLFAQEFGDYTHVIMNPPYKKIRNNSAHRVALRQVGIETVNLYSAFLSLAIMLTIKGGYLVAIIPRSFCNGPYYRSFREFILDSCAIHHIHLFDSRNKVFKDDSVLQENIIIMLERGGVQGRVRVSTSSDDRFVDLIVHEHTFERIIFPNDAEKFIHVPTSDKKSMIESFPGVCYSLSDIGVSVSTGPVIDFRLKEFLRKMPEDGCVPLVYPVHLRGGLTTWPIEESKKPNAIVCNDLTEKRLLPAGHYCVVRRFSTKEERRRIVASVVEPKDFGDYVAIGFENHLNVFHENKKGLPEALALGLKTYLNTLAVDEFFRRFNGHTQVNATDLRQMKYPSRETLIQLGSWAKKKESPSQDELEEKMETMVS